MPSQEEDGSFFLNLTRGNEIGANSYLLGLGENRILLDSGMHPKRYALDAIPNFERIREEEIDAAIVSHAHLDHTGSLPVFQRHHPHAKVYLTAATGDVAEAMLHNSVNVMTSQREELDITDYPLFTHRQIDEIQAGWEVRGYGKAFPVERTNGDGSEGGDVECEFFSAGHVLGSAGVMLRHRGRSIFYTGDVHFENQTLTRGARFPEGPIDTVIIEATRGDTERPAGYTRHGEAKRLAEAIRETLARGGTVLIPVFALGKTQEVLTMIHEFKRGSLIPNVPVFIGGLSTKMTIIYDAYAKAPERIYHNFRLLDDVDMLMTLPRMRGRRRPRNHAPREFSPGCIYAVSSGMMTENTISNAYAQAILPGPNNCILFVGYADPESPAGRLLATEPGDLIQLDPASPAVPVGCRIERFDFSGHAPREELVAFVENARARRVFLVHGDGAALEWMRGELARRLPEAEIVIPPPGERVPL